MPPKRGMRRPKGRNTQLAAVPRPLGPRPDRSRLFVLESDFGAINVTGSTTLAQTITVKYTDLVSPVATSLQAMFDLFTIDRFEITFVPAVTTTAIAYDSGGSLQSIIPLVMHSAVDRAPTANVTTLVEVLSNPDCVTTTLTRALTRAVVRPKPYLPAFSGITGVDWTTDSTQWLSTGNTVLGGGSGTNVPWYGLNVAFRNNGSLASNVSMILRTFLRVREQES